MVRTSLTDVSTPRHTMRSSSGAKDKAEEEDHLDSDMRHALKERYRRASAVGFDVGPEDLDLPPDVVGRHHSLLAEVSRSNVGTSGQRSSQGSLLPSRQRAESQAGAAFELPIPTQLPPT